MKVAVVILNWNGKDLLEKFLPSVVHNSTEATVYLADNASTDDSVAFVSEYFPSVKIIQNKVNGGYAKGYNDALKNLSEEIFVLLNSDVEVTENWLNPILSQFEKDEKVAAAQPRIRDYKNKEYFEYAGAAGGFIDKYGYPFCRGRIFDTLEKDTGQYNDISEIFWASGACLFVKSKAFWDAGGLDEDYFAHQEEIDLCWRLQANGGKILYVGNSKVYHVGGATLASANPQKTFYNFRNSLLNLLKNAKGAKIYPILFLRLVLDGVAAIQFLLQGKANHFFCNRKSTLQLLWIASEVFSKEKKICYHDSILFYKIYCFSAFYIEKKIF